ncbi:MAG: TraB/GumN family protein [Saprospiraceae bacterium]|nr:TraB/GumN family protein [Saprospiraceae bacterium]
MKYFTSLFFAFIIGFGGLFAQPTEAPAIKSTAPTAEENALLWRISGKDLATTSYLYGTIHMIGKADFFLTDSTRSAIDRAKLVTFEINMEDMMNLPAQMGLMMKSFMADGKSLSDLLSKEDYALVKAHFDNQGLPLFLFERMKPMFLTVLADADMGGGGLGGDGDMVSYEMKIMEIAEQQKKKMGGLETAEYQMSMFDSIPYEAQAKMLVETIKSSGSTEDGQFDQMVELYKNQDIVGMGTMMGEDEGIGEYEDLLLNTRNRNWIPIMGEMMLAQPSFFAVGAGHLGGDQGVVSLLRKAGYTVEPVR